MIFLHNMISLIILHKKSIKVKSLKN